MIYLLQHLQTDTHLRVLSITRAAIQLFFSSIDFASSTTLGWSRGRISKEYLISDGVLQSERINQVKKNFAFYIGI